MHEGPIPSALVLDVFCQRLLHEPFGTFEIMNSTAVSDIAEFFVLLPFVYYFGAAVTVTCFVALLPFNVACEETSM